MINYIDPSRTASPYTSLPVIGHGKEPAWLTRQAAATARLRELNRKAKIARLTAGRDGSKGVVANFRSALGLA